MHRRQWPPLHPQREEDRSRVKHCHPPAPGLPPVTPARQSVRQLSGHLSAALWPGSDQTSRHRGVVYTPKII